MIKLAIVLLSLTAATLRAADTVYWSDAELKAYAAKLAPKVNQDHFAVERFDDFGSHYALIVYREGNGPAEVHESVTDFYVVQTGEATLHTGGEIVNPKTVEPGEVRGSSIKGGKTIQLKPGDTVNIPPKTPHQVVIEPGKKVSYLIVKIHAK